MARRRKKGLPHERRHEIEARLSALHDELGDLLIELSAAYPNTGPIVTSAVRVLKWIDDLRFGL